MDTLVLSYFCHLLKKIKKIYLKCCIYATNVLSLCHTNKEIKILKLKKLKIMTNLFENTTGEKFTTVDKSEFIVYRYDGGQYGICRNDGIGSDCVFGGDPASEDDYNEEYMQEVYNEWNGDLVDMNDYGWRIEL